jgi:hypothetical protein
MGQKAIEGAEGRREGQMAVEGTESRRGDKGMKR